MRTATILLVDDDDVLTQVLRRVLMRDGYHVVEAGSIAQALERVREQKPDLALVDLVLPDGDGADLARQLQEERVRCPLILVTASPLRLRDEPDLARPFAHVLSKPLNLDELRQTIEACLAVTPPSGSGSRPRVVEAATPRKADTVAPTGGQGGRPPVRRRRLLWASAAVLVVAAAGLVAALPALGMPGLHRLLRRHDEAAGSPRSIGSWAEMVPGTDEEIELPDEVIAWLGVKTAKVPQEVAPQSLDLAGSLSFDPNNLGRVQSRFGGEVVSITQVPDNTAGPTRERQLRYGDAVKKGQILAVVLSKDLGEKKSDLIDALVQLQLDEVRLQDRLELWQRGALPEDTLNQTRRDVATDRNAAAKAERTLRTWKVPEEEVEAVKAEARRVAQRKGQRNLEKEMEWAKVEVRAPFDGIIVEKNVALGNIVDTTFDLFKVADLSRLGVLVHAYEEDLRALASLPRPYPWRVRVGADPGGPLLETNGLQQIGLVIDPTQHTDPIMGLVENRDGKLRVGQFVTATVDLPAPKGVVSLPASALDENGAESVIFVQPDPPRHRYVMRRVSVAMRLRARLDGRGRQAEQDVVYVRSELPGADWKKGLRPVKPGETTVTEGVLELKAELENLQAKKNAKK